MTLNFRKRQSPPAQQQEPAPTGGTLAVWGSPGCGKTTLSVKLAQHLAIKGASVVLLLCDMTAPMLPCICPPDALEGEGSLGSLFTAEEITPSLVQYHCHAHKRYENLLLLGLRKGENESSCREPTPKQVEQLLTVLGELASCVVVDCTSPLIFDPLSTVAIQQADASVRLVGCDLKSVSYLSSQLPYLLQAGWCPDNQYKAVGNLRPEQAEEAFLQMLGGAAFRFPHGEELWQQGQAGDLLDELSLKSSRPFRKEVAKLAKEVFGV